MAGQTTDRLVEKWLPLPEVNLHTSVEMAFRISRNKYRRSFIDFYGVEPRVFNVGTPQLANLHPWPARRPTAPARLLTLASILPANFSHDLFRRISGLEDIPILAMQNILPILLHSSPRIEELSNILKEYNKTPGEIVVVDPMAGGGSIPLESLRLGFRTIAAEYNPVAYLILKATLEYPAKFGMKLYDEVRAEAKALIKYAVDELSKYYPEDAMNYIIARGYRCWSCKGLVPIIHDVKLGKDGPYIKLTFDKEKKTFNVDIVGLEPEFERLRCPYCGVSIDRETALKDWVKRHKKLLAAALSGDIKEAEKHIDMLHETHILLVKQTERGFAPAGELDRKKFAQAYLDLTKNASELKKYLPLDPISKENEVFAPIRNSGIEYWFELFNHRQLLILTLLFKYLEGKEKNLVETKGEIGAAICIYLSFGIDKISNYNTIVSTWHESHSVIRDLTGHYATRREISLGLEYCELKVPLEERSIGWVFEPDVEKPTATRGGILPVLRELCSWLEGLGDCVEVYMADARELSSLLGEGCVDVINVDPPYFAQHNYSDISEFFWQLLRIPLKPAIDMGLLFNRDSSRGRVELHVPGWSPVLSVVPREGEIIERRMPLVKTPVESHTRDWYVQEMWRFFKECYKVLRDDGILIVWFTHSDPEAWEGILSALYASGFMVTRAWTIRTEMAERRVALAGSAFFSSLALIAKKGGSRIVVGSKEIENLARNSEVRDTIIIGATEALQSAMESGASEREAYIMALAGAIAGATRVRNPLIESTRFVGERKLDEVIWGKSFEDDEVLRFKQMRRFFTEVLYPLALHYGTQRVLESVVKQVFRGSGFDESLVEGLVMDILGVDGESKAYLLLWMSTRYSEEPTVEYDFMEKMCKVIGTSTAKLRFYGFVEGGRGRSSDYRLAYGDRMLDLAGRRTDLLVRTAVGSAILLTRAVAEIPKTEVPEKLAEKVVAEVPVSKMAVAVALFLMLTAKEHELRSVGVTDISKPLVLSVLKAIYKK
ncbi:DUF1156 domain-containing protein [Candidatus Bathyarchaeota archaeon]|nr:DUF1156 domain-containing protein [Candidatus Bathyarchaeota archaeon]